MATIADLPRVKKVESPKPIKVEKEKKVKEKKVKEIKEVKSEPEKKKKGRKPLSEEARKLKVKERSVKTLDKYYAIDLDFHINKAREKLDRLLGLKKVLDEKKT